MAKYELIAKGSFDLGSGHTILKGDSFTIGLSGFGGNMNEIFLDKNRLSVLKQIKTQYDIELPPQKLTNASFAVVKIG